MKSRSDFINDVDSGELTLASLNQHAFLQIPQIIRAAKAEAFCEIPGDTDR
jgi:hypothetical protein